MAKIKELLINLDEERKVNIINSAMKEFSRNSFQQASTNIIVKDAGISKGLLFHYFGTKAKLYEYLEYFSMKTVTENIVEKMDWKQEDIFLRLKEISMIKFKLFQKYPYLAEFFLKIYENKTAEEILDSYPDASLELYSEIYIRNIDYSLFKEGVDVEKAIDIIRWTLEKHNDEFRKKIKREDLTFDYKTVEQELFEYIDILKKCFYKEGVL